jgi:hypothetical protein
MAVDTAVMFGMAQRLLQSGAEMTWRKLLVMGFALVTFVLAAVPSGLATKGVFLSVVFFIYAMSSWFLILSSDEKTLLMNQPLKHFKS